MNRSRNIWIVTVASLCLWGAMAHGANVVLNEFMAQNHGTITNKEGVSDADWLEIYNAGGSTVNLLGWRLTDDPSRRGKWKFPSTSLAPGEYLIVWCDNSNRVINGELHTSFKLSANADGYLALINSNVVMATEYVNYPQQYQNLSYGLGASGEQRYFAHATPGSANDFASASNVVADTKFFPDRGFYTNAFTLSITSATVSAGAQIRYTLNYDVPTTNSTLYTNGVGINISSTTVVRAAAFLGGFLASLPDTQTYIFPNDVIHQSPNHETPGPGWPAQGTSGTNGQTIDYGMDPRVVTNSLYSNQMMTALLSIPSVSMVTPLTNLFDTAHGVYVNAFADGSNWERAASVELINPDGTKGFHIDCGFRIRGGYSRNGGNPKHGFRLFFRSDYGYSALNYDVYNDDPTAAKTFDKLDLATAENYSWSLDGSPVNTMVRDQVDSDAMLRMGQLASRNKYCHLYLNGQYWGLYFFQERPEASFAASYLGGTKTDYDVLKADGGGAGSMYNMVTTDGDSNSYYRLWFYTMNTGFVSVANYYRVQGLNPDGTVNSSYENLVNVDSMADFMLSVFYSGDDDEPCTWYQGGFTAAGLYKVNNYYTSRDRTGSHGGFRYICHDAEHSYDQGLSNNVVLLSSASNTLFTYFNPHYVHQLMSTNGEYRLRFADHVYRNLYNGGPLSTAVMQSNIQQRVSQIDTAIIAESARWGDSKEPMPYTKASWLTALYSNGGLYNFFNGRPDAVVTQLRALGWYPSVDPPTFSQEGGVFTNGFSLTMSAANTICYTLDGTDPRQLGTGAARGTLFTNGVGVVLQRNTHVMARAMTSTNQWSAVHEAVFTLVDESPLRVTEVMYSPADPQGTETNLGVTGSAFEFIELLNTGSSSVGLAGLKFNNGVTFDFTGQTNVISLGVGQYLLVVSDLDAFKARYSNWGTMNIAGEFQYPANTLNNGGEKVTLVDGLGRQVSSFTYNNWYPATDGAGHSLIPLVTAYQTNNVLDYKANWRASSYIAGSPGAADPVPVATNIVFNEIMAHTDYNTNLPPEYNSDDWIELYNTTASDFTFGNDWYLSSDPSDLKQWQIPATNKVLLHAWRVFDEVSDFHVGGTNGTATNGFGLSKLGDMVFLSYLPGNSSNRVVDAKSFNGQERDKSYGRYPDGNADWYPMAITKGSSNSLLATQEIVISEVIYHPRPTADNPENNENDEYIELYNPSSSAVTLDTPAEGGPWQIDGGAQYTFPSNTVIPAGGYIVVVPFNPTNNVEASNDFCVAYGLTNGQVRMFGGFKGHLDNEIDRIALERPVAPDVPGELTGWFEVDEVKYWDQSPWPLGVDGTGKPLQKKMNRGSGNDPTNWVAGFVATPGYAAVKVAITNPPEPCGFLVPFSVYVGADVDSASVSGSIHNVAFYDGSTLLCTTSSAPYGFLLSGIANAGVHYLNARLTDDAGVSTSPYVLMTVYTNAPNPDAGKDQMMNILNYNVAGLAGTMTYNGIPTQQVSTVWSLFSGSPGVVFGQPSNLTTTVSFSSTGTYVLCLTTTYGLLTSNDYVTIVVVNTNTLNTVPYGEPFEEYVNGERIGGINGWYVSGANAAVVETNNYAASYTNGFPLTNAHQLVLKVDGAATNAFQGTTVFTNLWVDMIMECRQWIDPGQPVADPNAQFSVYITTNNHLSVWHCVNPSNLPLTNIWTELPDTNISSNQFARLTVQGSYTREINNCFKFRLWLNGTALTNPATWYYTASTNNNYLNRVTASGIFHMDDLAVQIVDPLNPGGWQTIQTFVVGRGTITPWGPVLVPLNGTTNFIMISSNWYHVVSVVVDSTNNLGAVTNYTFSNVVNGHSITATFSADMAASNTPKWWLAQFYPTNDAALNSGATNDTDIDGAYGWQEYIAGTMPTDSGSVFRVVITMTNSQIIVTCPTTSAGPEYDGQSRYYSMQKASNIVVGTWQDINGMTNVLGAGQTIVYTNSANTNYIYYRGKVFLQ